MQERRHARSCFAHDCDVLADVNFVPIAVGAMRSLLASVADLAPVEAAVDAARAYRAQCQVILEGVKAAAGTRGCGGHDALCTLSWPDLDVDAL